MSLAEAFHDSCNLSEHQETLISEGVLLEIRSTEVNCGNILTYFTEVS